MDSNFLLRSIPLMVALVAVQQGSAAAADLVAPLSRSVSFEKDVHPVLAAKCFECHGGDQRKGDFQIDSREALLEGGKSGPAVILNKSAESYLIELVAGLDDELRMPKEGPPLSDEEVAVLRAWIDQGVPWDYTGPQHDAYRPSVALLPVDLPPLTPDAQNPVDRLLAPYFAEHGVASPDAVSDPIFARRVYLDIVGLLPPPGAVRKFVADTHPEKRRRLVRKLLEDRQGYAEHWMTFWNDALRNDFVGTGYIDGGRKQITAWLYDALYTNLAYDQFAAQLINPGESARGFVYGIVWRGVTAANEQPPMQAARNVAQVFLGVNLKCASCHDSFVDHWTLNDAYGLASVFASGPLELVRCDIPQGETAQPKFLWPEVGTINESRPTAGRQAQLARLLTAESNGFFTRTIVNRLWAGLFGRGLVEPLVTMENEAWNPGLLDWLAQDLIDNGYDLKGTLEVIMTSRAYQWPAVPRPAEEGGYIFRGPHLKRLSAEQFADAVSSLTGQWQREPKFNPPHVEKERAKQIRAWRGVADSLTRALGRPNREQTVLRRESDATTLQALELTNGEILSGKLDAAAEALLATAPATPLDLVGKLYGKALQRPPTAKELKIARGILGKPMTRQGLADFLWSLVMLPEFQYIY